MTNTQSPPQIQPNAIITIANPVGERDKTNGRRALHHINRGQAVLLDDGRLWFKTRAQIVRDNEREMEASLLNGRQGVLSWNGSSKEKRLIRRPGECRS